MRFRTIACARSWPSTAASVVRPSRAAIRVAGLIFLALPSACTTGTAAPAPSSQIPAVASASPSPSSPACTIRGTHKDDRLKGTPEGDVICGLGGDDVIHASSGNDVLRGGSGDDEFFPGAGDDLADGGAGRDLAGFQHATAGITVLMRSGSVTGDGNDSLADIEWLVGSSFADRIWGSEGADRIDGGNGADLIRGLAGDDEIDGGSGNDRLWGGDGVDTCVQGDGKGKVACERAWRPVPFARVGALTLYQPALDPLLIAFHESLFVTAAVMKPVGEEGKDYMIQPSRGRGTPATSAVDIPLEKGTQVVSPVDGKVADVVDYLLYCQGPDTLVVIRPDEAKDQTVIVMHLVDVRVKRGDEVVAAGTVLGLPHLFEGSKAEVNAFVPGDPPHVHIEVEADGSKAVPGCGSPGDPTKSAKTGVTP